MMSPRTVSTFRLRFTVCYSVSAEAVEAQVVPLYYVYPLGVVGYCRTLCTTVRCFTKSAYFLWRKYVVSTGLILQLRRLFEFPASITFNSLSRHFCRSDKDQFDDPCSLVMFFRISSGIFFKITGTSNAPYELSI